MLTIVEIEPPVLFAQIMYWVVVQSSVGVPVIIPVDELNCNPSGNSPSISHKIISPEPTIEGD